MLANFEWMDASIGHPGKSVTEAIEYNVTSHLVGESPRARPLKRPAVEPCEASVANDWEL